MLLISFEVYPIFSITVKWSSLKRNSGNFSYLDLYIVIFIMLCHIHTWYGITFSCSIVVQGTLTEREA